MQARAIVVGLAVSLLGARVGMAAPDPKAMAVADKVVQSLGGQQAWDATHFLRFDFAVEREGKEVVRRSHTWDKYTGRYRLEAKTKEGKPFVVLMNINTKDGHAWLDGKPLEGPELKDYLERGYGIWVNDTYWLTMPYKLHDPGVNLAYAGEEKDSTQTWDKLSLTFDNVGLTPKDKYWVWVNRDSGMVDRWDFVLGGKQEPPSSWMWKGWTQEGGIKLAPERVSMKDKMRIWFPTLTVSGTLPDDVFSKP
jgi:hypothetical protein